jgi:hypothetical protein
MAIELIVDVVPPEGGKVFVTHIFRGETEAEAREVYAQHAKGCEFLTPAIEEDRVEEEVQKISDDEWPAYEDDPGPDDEDEEEEGDAEEE